MLDGVVGPVGDDEADVVAAGAAVLRRGAVGDVLPGERLLVHLGPHVAGVDGVDPQGRVLGGEDAGDLVGRRLGRAVAAPALVGLDGGVLEDVKRVAGQRRLRRRAEDSARTSPPSTAGRR